MKRAVRSKQMSEYYEKTSNRMSKWPSTSTRFFALLHHNAPPLIQPPSYHPTSRYPLNFDLRSPHVNIFLSVTSSSSFLVRMIFGLLLSSIFFSQLVCYQFVRVFFLSFFSFFSFILSFGSPWIPMFTVTQKSYPAENSIEIVIIAMPKCFTLITIWDWNQNPSTLSWAFCFIVLYPSSTILCKKRRRAKRFLCLMC